MIKSDIKIAIVGLGYMCHSLAVEFEKIYSYWIWYQSRSDWSLKNNNALEIKDNAKIKKILFYLRVVIVENLFM